MKTWQKTRLQNLLRHKSGRYYARAFCGGKEIWKSLKTADFKVAEAKLGDFKRDRREQVATTTALNRGTMTFADALAAHMQKRAADAEAGRTKQSTVHYWKQVFRALLKSWPDLAERDVRRITPAECKQWAQFPLPRTVMEGAAMPATEELGHRKRFKC
jgi:hypothetical protein